MGTSLFLFKLLIFLLPIQLGRHFFFNFSFISGLRSDYLAPTLYLTDIVALILVIFTLVHFSRGNHKINTGKRKKIFNPQFVLYFSLVFLYLLFTSIFIAVNSGAAFYRLVKISELVMLGYVIYKIKPNVKQIIFPLSVGLTYSSFVGLLQFILHRSLGGVFWFMGERTFSSSTPGIASISLPQLFGSGSVLVMRPYSIFPHPNVLGGFLAMVLPLILASLIFKKLKTSGTLRWWYNFCLILGIVVVVLTFSRTAWLMTVIGLGGVYFLEKKKNLLLFFKSRQDLVLIAFYFCVALSFLLPSVLPSKPESYRERARLNTEAFSFISQYPVLGVGLNNFTTYSYKLFHGSYNLNLLQPVHNIYLLILAETGLAGFALFIFFISYIIKKSLQTAPVIFLAVVQLLLLGMFDHYLITLQQGQLLFVLFASLAFLPQNT